MSISLKNHEDRIKVLEQFKSLGNITKLWTGSIGNGGTITTSERLNNFGVLFLIADGNTSKYYGACTILTDYFISSQYSTCILPTSAGGIGDHFRVQYVSDNQFKVVNHNGLRSIINVYGLKLYYSFSYNIIYRAMHLLEKFMSQTKEVLAYEY